MKNHQDVPPYSPRRDSYCIVPSNRLVLNIARLADNVPGMPLDDPRAHVVVHALLEKHGVGERLRLFRHPLHVQ